MHRKEENLTENHTTPMVSEVHTKQSINEENSSLFMNITFCRKAKTKVETYLKMIPETVENILQSYSEDGIQQLHNTHAELNCRNKKTMSRLRMAIL